MRTSLLLVCLVACGDGQSPAAPDAEAPYDVGPTGAVSVYVAYPKSTVDATPIAAPGAIVLFSDADGHLVDRQIAGADGVATGQAPADATVTVLPPPGTQEPRYSWVGAQPGDSLYTNEVFTWSPPGDGHSVLLPRDGDDATLYAFAMPGFGAYNNMPGAADPVVAVGYLVPDSLTAHDALATVRHADGHGRYFIAHEVTVGAQPLDLTAATWVDSTGFDYSIAGIPADVVWLTSDYGMYSGGAELWSDGGAVVPDTSSATIHVEMPPAIGDSTGVEMIFQRGHEPDATYWAISYNGPPSTIDMAAIAPPAATDIAVSPDGATTWNVAGDPAHALGAQLTVYSQTGEPWIVLAPPDRRALQLPPVPADLPAFGTATRAAILYVGGNDPSGYAALRTDQMAFRPDWFGKVMPATPGVYRYSGD